jgi:hypothetical protein
MEKTRLYFPYFENTGKKGEILRLNGRCPEDLKQYQERDVRIFLSNAFVNAN